MDDRQVLRAALAAASLAVGACATIASVENAGVPECAGSLQSGLASILVAEGEKPEVAASLARDSVRTLSESDAGPRPFLVSSPSGADYELFVQKKRSACLLRLYATQKGFTRYTNNLTYIATRGLEGCACSE